MIKTLYASLAILALTSCASKTIQIESPIPKGFVHLKDVDASIVQDMRYATDHNFIGKPIQGYSAQACILTAETAQALKQVQTELKQKSLSLKVYDCYRPQKAVDHFVAWAKDTKDTLMKKEFYPHVDKANLFKDGYIAEKSGHSRGSTMDLTIVEIPTAKQESYKHGDSLSECILPKAKRFKDNSLDFGTGYDCFDPLSHTDNPKITGVQKQNRQLLKSVMEKYGFKNYADEWWHYTLKDETFPDTYFNFPVF